MLNAPSHGTTSGGNNPPVPGAARALGGAQPPSLLSHHLGGGAGGTHWDSSPLPGTSSALTRAKRIQTQSLTLQTPSPSRSHGAGDASSRGPATARDGPSHTAPHNNFSSVPSSARQPPQLGTAVKALQSPGVSVPSTRGLLRRTAPAQPHARLWGSQVITARRWQSGRCNTPASATERSSPT